MDLPFSLYSTFVLEEKFGFNKQTLTLFFTDMIKSQVLGIVIGTPLMAVNVVSKLLIILVTSFSFICGYLQSFSKLPQLHYILNHS